MIISSSAMATVISAVSKKLGTELPNDYTAALTVARSLPSAADQLADLSELHTAALDAIAANRDPAADKTVQRLAIHRALTDAGIRAAAEARATVDIRTAIAEHSDAIIESWSQAIQADLVTLADAAAELHLDSLTGVDHTHLRQTGRLVLWSDASNAADRADEAVRGIEAILGALAVNHDKQRRALLLSPDITLDAYNSIGTADRGAWSVARTGAPLRLASVPDFTAAVGRIAAEAQAAQRQADAERLEAERNRRREIPKRSIPPLAKQIG